MKTKRTVGLVAVSLTLIFSILACGGSSSPSPTTVKAEPSATVARVAEPTATEEVAQPSATAKVVKPTAAPTAAKPTATGGSVQPTQAVGGATPDCANVPDGKLGVAYVGDYQDTLDTWWVIGLVCNKTTAAVDNIQLDTELFDKSGKSLHKEQNVSTAIDNLDAGEATPFSVNIYDNIGTPDKVTATITSSDAVDLKRAKLDTQGVVTTIDDQGDVHITGELINHGSDPVEIHGVAAATFDKDGKMFTADSYSVLIHYLGPGVSGPFRITMFGPKGGTDALDPKNNKLYIDAETTDHQTFLVDAEKDLTDLKDYLDNSGQFHMAGELTNNGDKNVGVRLVATVYDKDDNVLDASSTDTAISAIKPGETIPYSLDYWGPLDNKKGLFDDKADHFTVQVDPMWTWATDMELFDLKTKNDSNKWDKDQGTFTGEVINNTGGDLESAMVMVGIYGKKGTSDENKLVATDSGYADIKDKLANGNTAPYTVSVAIPTGFNIDNYSYQIVVKGKKP